VKIGIIFNKKNQMDERESMTQEALLEFVKSSKAQKYPDGTQFLVVENKDLSEINIEPTIKLIFKNCKFTSIAVWGKGDPKFSVVLDNCKSPFVRSFAGAFVFITNGSTIKTVIFDREINISSSNIGNLLNFGMDEVITVRSFKSNYGYVTLDVMAGMKESSFHGGSVEIIKIDYTREIKITISSLIAKQKLIFRSLENAKVAERKLTLNGITTPVIEITSAGLSNFIFTNFDLGPVKLRLYNLLDFRLNYKSVRFSENLSNYQGWKDKYELRYYLREFKINAARHSDYILERIFASMELETYLNESSRFKQRIFFHPLRGVYRIMFPVFSFCKRFPFIKLNYNPIRKIETWPLWLSKITNEFGRNWILPALWLIDLSAFFFICIVALMCKGQNWLQITDQVTRLWDNGVFLQFLLPTHSFSLFSTYNQSFQIHVVDSLQRLTSGYLIFQQVRAFRFHVAK
jgi:hypothetical protein